MLEQNFELGIHVAEMSGYSSGDKGQCELSTLCPSCSGGDNQQQLPASDTPVMGAGSGSSLFSDVCNKSIQVLILSGQDKQKTGVPTSGPCCPRAVVLNLPKAAMLLIQLLMLW